MWLLDTKFWINCRKGMNVFLEWLIVWFLCSLPSFISMLIFWGKGIRLEKPSLYGIEAEEILIYVLSFSAPVLIQVYFYKKCPKILSLSCFLVYLVATVLFVILKTETFQQKLSCVFDGVMMLYVFSFLCSLFSVMNSAFSSDRKIIEDINSRKQLELENSLDKKIKEQEVKNGTNKI